MFEKTPGLSTGTTERINDNWNQLETTTEPEPAKETEAPINEWSMEQLIDKLKSMPDYEIFNGPYLEEYLKRREEAARLNTLNMEKDPNRSGVVILVCAQHPLTPEGKPGEAFAARLDEAILRYGIMKNKGEQTIIRVPGDIHGNDQVSLAEAGEKYLKEAGIPEEDISADGTEQNGTDEITSAYSLLEQAQAKRLYIICAENQVPRNKMACMELFEFLPYFCTVTTPGSMPHRAGFEYFNPNGMLRFLREDQGGSVDQAARTRHLTGEDVVDGKFQFPGENSSNLSDDINNV